MLYDISPSAAVILCGVIGLVLTWRRVRAGQWLLIASAAAVAVVAITPVSTWMLRPLETRFAKPVLTHVDGIIVLGGAISLPRSIAVQHVDLNRMAGRMTTFAMLARRYPSAKKIFSGGGRWHGHAESEAVWARQMFEGLGVRDVRYEDRSRNTHENAVFSAAMIHPKPGEVWLLVTSAPDLPRAVGAFRGAGWPVVGYPADHHALGSGWFSGLSDGFADLDWAAHEWIGLIYYRLRGWTPALLPGPER